ncbi:hypothetical protein PYW07_009165 [Mythimna separata]|uniref:Uncharacterized protein n=1 Tax=Mythimna separata TaxID=271217 RepID=A0AAD7YBF2_MYTSE|nr:hypothetical protein PYW07_009165 [Mythimna separata]
MNARLIEKNTERTLTTETNTTGSSPPVRLTRDAFDEDSVAGSSKEEASDEERPYNKKMRNYSKSKPKTESSSLVRVIRESHEKTEKTKKNTTAPHHVPTKQKTLVKKPIPKYNNEMDYDEDFQMKMNRSPVRLIDSGEHEDEDFNVDDYEFDVNHDEFIGRGKPLEPRLKNKNQGNSNRALTKKESKSTHHTGGKTPSKAQQSPASHRPISNKRSAPYVPKKAGEKEDYYDDTTTVQSVTEKQQVTRDSDDEFGDDNEDSKEFESKGTPNVRTIRSPFKFNTFVDKYSSGNAVMSKVLTILPMFPEVPKTDEHQMNPSMKRWYSPRRS